MGFSSQEYWSGLLCSPPGDLLSPGIKSRSSALQADSLPSEPPRKTPPTPTKYTQKQVHTCPQTPELLSKSELWSALWWDYPNWPSSLQQTPTSSTLCYEDLSDLISILCSVIQSCPIFATPWTVAHQSPLSIGFFQARIWEPVAISFSKEPSWPGDRTLISCVGWKIFYHWVTSEALILSVPCLKKSTLQCTHLLIIWYNA